MRRRRQPRDERKKAQGQERGDGQSLSVKRNVGGMRTRIGVRELMGEGQKISVWGGKGDMGLEVVRSTSQDRMGESYMKKS